jgi:hypothetical protein
VYLRLARQSSISLVVKLKHTSDSVAALLHTGGARVFVRQILIKKVRFTLFCSRRRDDMQAASRELPYDATHGKSSHMPFPSEELCLQGFLIDSSY